MANENNGGVKIPINAETSGLDSGIKEAKAKLQSFKNWISGNNKVADSMFENIKTDKLTAEIDKTKNEIKSTISQLEVLKKKYNDTISGTVPVPSVKKQQTAFDAQAKKTESANAAFMTQSEKTDVAYDYYKHDPTAFSKAEYEKQNTELQRLEGVLEQETEKAEALRAKLKDLKINPQSTEEAQKLKNEIEKTTNKVSELQNKLNIQTKAKAEQQISNVPQPSDNSTKNVASGMSVIKARTEDARKSANGFQSEMSRAVNHIKRLAGIAFVYTLFRKAFSAIAQYIGGLLTSNQQFSNSLAQIKGNLMMAFTPIYNYILPAINALMQGIAMVTGYIAKFTSSIFGMSSGQMMAQTKTLNASSAINTETSALKDAKKESEDTSASFDQFNKIQGESDDTADTGTSGGSGSTSGTTSPIYDLSNTAGDFLGKIQSMDWAGITQKVIDGLLKVVDGILKAVPIFMAAATTIIVGFVTGFVNSIPDIVAIIPDLLTAVESIVLGIINILGQIVPVLISAIPSIIAAALQIIVGLVNIIMESLPQIIAIIPPILKAIADAIIASLPLILQCGADLILSLIDGIMATLDALIDALPAIMEVYRDYWTEQIPELVEKGIEILLYLIQGITDRLPDLIDTILQLMMLIVNQIIEMLPQIIVAGFQIITTLNSALIQMLPEIALCMYKIMVKMAEFIVGNIGFIADAGRSIIEGLINAFIEKKEKFKQSFRDMFSSFPSIIKNAFNDIIDRINDFTETISAKLKFTLPGKLGTFGFTVPKIPKLAAGAVIPPNSEFMAILGDQKSGTNIETPLNTMVQAMTAALQTSGYAGNGNITIPVYIGTDKIDEIVVNAAKRRALRSGGNT